MSTNNDSNVKNEFINNIDIIFIFGHKVTEVLFLTKDDKCYEFRKCEIEELGLSHNRQVREPKFIEKLCYKQIISFANVFSHVMSSCFECWAVISA
jgi:hypothetical protein